VAETVLVIREHRVATVTLNRAERFNAFDLAMLSGLAAELITLAADPNVGAVILAGAGKAFCAGGDLRWAVDREGGPGPALHELSSRLNSAVLELHRMAKPTIAAIDGVAAGGGLALALACDFRVMAEGARMVQAYTSSGLSIDGGGTYFLPRLVGQARALEIAAFDEPIDSEKALAWGLATRLCENGAALRVAQEMAAKLLNRAEASFAWSKRLLGESWEAGFEQQIQRERTGLVACAEHPDGKEGLRAFTEKRRPDFSSPKK
jgi:2-(1,2-epoxy-1,2-dihydrophenyl)acetyl-CoA isomerase